MAFGFAGAAAGAAKSLEDILAQQMVQAQLEQRKQDTARRLQMDETRLNAQLADADEDRKFRARQEDRAAAQDRDKNNRLGVRRMIGESLMQRQGALTPEDRRSIAALQVEAGDMPDVSLLSEPPKKLRNVTVPGPNGRPLNKMVSEDEAVEEYREPKAPAAPRAAPDQVWVKRNGVLTPIAKGSAQPGDEPYDAVAARSSAPANQAEAQDTAREAVRLATALRDSKGFSRAFGAIDAMLPTINQDTADAEGLRDSLTSLLTLENMGKMKGVLSDSDMRVLRQASTTLSPRMGDAAARSELNRIIQTLGKVGTVDGTAPPAGDARVDALLKKYGGGL